MKKAAVPCILVAVILLAVAVSAKAQQAKKIPRIGILIPVTPAAAAIYLEAFKQGLRGLGYIEGQNIAIDYRYAEGKSDRLPALAAELVRLKVDIIVAVGRSVQAAKKSTETISIVMTNAGDPVNEGFVASLARPGGNVTGLSSLTTDLAGKRLELLKETIPKLSRLAVLWDPENKGSTLSWKENELAARELGLQLQSLAVRSPEDLDVAFRAAAKERSQALVALRSPVIFNERKRIVDLTIKSHLPAIYDDREFIEPGGLMSYGTNQADLFRRAATYVDKILKGRKPADLPVEQPKKFEFIINLKAAKQIGLTIPPNVLARADKVIK
jgi:putative tryptophan/tyrosine transport system substrate-binding protein